MPDENETPNTPAETPSAPQTPAETPATPKVFDEAYVGELRREAAKYRTSAKEAADALEAARKEAEEAKAGVPALESRATAAESRALRLEVALDKGLPVALVGRLQGSTREEIEADAASLMALVAPPQSTPLDYGQGSNTDPAPAKVDMNAALRAFTLGRS